MMDIFGQDPPPTVSSPCNINDYQACDTSFRYQNKDKSVNGRTSPSSLSSGNYRNICPSLGAPNSNLSNPRYTSPACQDRYNNQYGLPSKERPQPEQSRPRPHPFSNPRGNRNAISPPRPVSSNTQCSQSKLRPLPPQMAFVLDRGHRMVKKCVVHRKRNFPPYPSCLPPSSPHPARLPASPLHPPALPSIIAKPAGALASSSSQQEL